MVSVVIPVWDAAATLRQCLDSALAQTIGLERLEVIAVDDGSTDESGAILDEYADRCPSVRVVHQANSGGPGGPRNVGSDLASGRYVFFLDADDYLGPEALERLVAMAERNGSDIVAGRVVGLDGRVVPDVWRTDVDRADVEQVYRTVAALKLFRRSFIERLGLRFTEGLSGCEEGPFTVRAYLGARVISVLASYPCYYARRSSGTRPPPDPLVVLEQYEHDRFLPVAAARKPGVARDALMIRHIAETARTCNRAWLRLDPAMRHEVFATASRLVARWCTDRIEHELAAWDAIRVHCLRQGLEDELADIVAAPAAAVFGRPVVERGRVFAGYPHFRDGSGIPDRCFDITRRVRLRQELVHASLEGSVLHVSGTAYLALLGGVPDVRLHRRPFGPDVPVPTTSTPTPKLRDTHAAYPNAGFDAVLDLRSLATGRLPAGPWDIVVGASAAGLRRTARPRVPGPGAVVGDRGSEGTAYRLRATRIGTLRLEVGQSTRAMAWLDRADRTIAASRRVLVRVMGRTHAGRLALLAIEHRRPGILRAEM